MVTFFIRLASIIFWSVVIIACLIMPSYLHNSFGKKTINVFTWSNLLDAKYLREFQKETGIKVNLNYYESNEELLGKLGAGDVGYDLIVPSDYAVDWMIKKDMLKKLDKSRLTFLNRIDKKLLHNYYDPHNDYSVPYFWGVYGIIMNTDYYAQKDIPRSFKLIFDQRYVPYKICMPGNSREVIMMAAYYLFGDVYSLLDKDKREQVKELLIKQKKWVACYSDERIEYPITSRICSAVLALSPEFWRVKNECPQADFVVPKEGAFAVIDNFVIPKKSQKENLVYELLNHLYSDACVIHHSEQFGLCPPVAISDVKKYESFCSLVKDVHTIMFFDTNKIPDAIFNAIWIELMAA